jgi:hypothetical protein
MKLEEAHKVTRENVPAWLPSGFIQQLSAPPPIFWRGRDGNDITCLEVKLFFDRSIIIIEGFD